HVTVIDLLPRLLSLYLDQEFTDILTKTMADHGIYAAVGQGIKAYEGVDGHVTKVVTDQGEYPADLVVTAAGIRPATGFLKGVVDLDDHGLIKINDHLQTSDTD
ncbi:FAD-dependent oxidoreductase, partial [Klebsiella pneumoniae]|nr:FAD-dependent oxidoreductase [Klebsiella pneumoniae]